MYEPSFGVGSAELARLHQPWQNPTGSHLTRLTLETSVPVWREMAHDHIIFNLNTRKEGSSCRLLADSGIPWFQHSLKNRFFGQVGLRTLQVTPTTDFGIREQWQKLEVQAMPKKAQSNWNHTSGFQLFPYNKAVLHYVTLLHTYTCPPKRASVEPLIQGAQTSSIFKRCVPSGPSGPFGLRADLKVPRTVRPTSSRAASSQRGAQHGHGRLPYAHTQMKYFWNIP